MSSSGLSLIGALCLGAAVLAQAPAAPNAPVPEVVVRARCVTCHAVDLIQQQRISRPGWERELDKMIRWGAVVTDADRGPLLDYLGTVSLPRTTEGARADGGRGAELYAQRCLGCHGSDIIEQQRLGNAAWRREVDKMVGWGASIDADDKAPLVTYLADRFGVR